MNKELEFLEEKYGHNSWTNYPPSKQQVAQWLKEYTEKQFAISGVSKSFAVGENVKVERCIHGHEFELGQVVTIVEYEPSQTTSWLCSDGRNKWWLSEEEANVC